MKEKKHSFFCLKSILVFLGFAFVLLVSTGKLFAKDEDFGIWNAYDVEKKFHTQWKIKVGEELRYREGQGLHYFDSHVGAAYQWFKRLGFGADYLQVREKRKAGKKEEWFSEYRPRIYATLQETIYGFLLEYRNMLEFRMKESARHVIEDRNLTSVTAPYKWTPLELQPYVSNEAFLDFRGGRGFTQDRLISGFKIHIYRGLGGSIYYMRQFTKSKPAQWVDYNILGIAFKLAL